MRLVHKHSGEPRLSDYPVLRCTRCGWDIQQIDVPPPPFPIDPTTFICLACLYGFPSGEEA